MVTVTPLACGLATGYTRLAHEVFRPRGSVRSPSLVDKDGRTHLPVSIRHICCAYFDVVQR